MLPKFAFNLLFFSFYLFYPFASQAATNNWQIESVTNNQIIIKKKEKKFNFFINLKINQPILIKLALIQFDNQFNKQPSIIFKTDHHSYYLKKKQNTHPFIYETSLNTDQSNIFVKEIITKKNAYITFPNQTIELSLQGTTSMFNTALKIISEEKNSYTNNTTFFILYNFKNLIFTYPYHWICISIIVFITIFTIHKKFTLRNSFLKFTSFYRKKRAMKLAINEIKRHRKILTLKKEQLCYKDDYGSIIEDRWFKEIQRFIKTRIRPRLTKKNLVDLLPSIKKQLVKHIHTIVEQTNLEKKQNVNNVNYLKPLEYEAFCANLLQQIGWDAKVTNASGDQGADVIAYKNNKTLILQCKLYTKPVGNKAVQEVLSAKEFYHADYAAVVSNASYTVSARQLASSVQVALLHHELLQQFAKKLSLKTKSKSI